MKTWRLRQSLVAEVKLLVLEVVHQIVGYPLSPLQKHIYRERAKMTRGLWLKIMYRDNWRCKIKGPPCIGKAQEVDHKKALFNYGYTEERNLQAACMPCNKWKGVS